MRKEELRRLKRINATPKMVQMAENNKKDMFYKNSGGRSDRKMKTEYDLFVRTQTRGAYLMVCLFFPEKITAGELTPTYEIYCNREGDEYITRYLEKGEEKGWYTAMVKNLDMVSDHWRGDWERRSYPGIEKRIWQNPEGKKTIQQYLKTKETGIYGLAEWQQAAKDRETTKREEREKAPWDADMRLIPPVMPSFSKWMQQEAAGEYFIIYERKNKEPDTGWCSGCLRPVPVSKPRHNKKGRCVCGRDITFKAAGRIKTLSVSRYPGECIQKIKGGIVVREFEQYQYYRDADYTKPRIVTREEERILIMDDGTVKRYFYGNYKNKEHRYILDKGYRQTADTYYCYRMTKVYKKNLPELKKTALKNSAIDLWETLPERVTRYLAIERDNPAVEKLARIGMFKLAKDLIEHNFDKKLTDRNGSELAKILRIDNARFKRLRAIDGGVEHLKWYQYEKTADRIWPDAMIKDFGDAGLHGSSFGFLQVPLSYVKIWNYMKKQQTLTGHGLSRITDTWMDYLNMAEKAGMDVTNGRIWKPKDLQAAHNEVTLLLQQGEMEKEAEKLAKKWPKVNENVKKLRKFEYSDGRFSILAPTGILDIVKEGRILQHCVHTCDFYFDRIQKDETYLFFLRRADHEEIPWYTLEVEAGGNIRQKRTTGDNRNADFEEAVAFLKEWQKVFVKRMNAAEKEAGKRADRARKEEYKKLRKDGNKVWHGKLAGQLLADVLEADFMAAAT